MDIKTFSPETHYVKCVVYGNSGVGKTVFAGTAEDVLFASAEGGLLSIASTLNKAPDYVEINSMNDLVELYNFLKDGETKYKTLVIDSITEINEMIKNNMEKSLGHSLQIQDWGELSRKIKSIIKSMRSLPLHIIIICQEKIEKDGEIIKSITPLLNGKNATEIAYLMDIVGYMYIDEKGERHITTAPSPTLTTKDRSNTIGNDAPLDFNDWIKAINNTKIKTDIKKEKTNKKKY